MIAVTLAILQFLVTARLLKLSWRIVVRIEAISTANYFITHAGMRSGPDAVL